MTESIQILMEKDRLQPLADNIKVLKGSDSITLQQMEDTIEETNTDIVSQTDLITQLASALRGKNVPGGGGAALETSTVTISGCSHVFYTAVESGQLVAKQSNTGSAHSITVCRNTAVVCGHTESYPASTKTGATEIGAYGMYYSAYQVSGNTANIVFTEHTGGAN